MLQIFVSVKVYATYNRMCFVQSYTYGCYLIYLYVIKQNRITATNLSDNIAIMLN